MYIPTAYGVEDTKKIRGFIHAHGFATLITHKDGNPWASHLPVLLDEAEKGDILRSHMARNNEQWQHFESGHDVLCIFHGPHAYISPSWYVSAGSVPTWNYATVHVYGRARIETDYGQVRKILDDTTEKYESKRTAPWKMNFPEDKVASLMKAIVGFSIEVTRIEAKYKLGQNRSTEDRQSMLAGLHNSTELDAQILANFIEANV